MPVNINYRYLDEELWYLLDNSDAEALVFHASLGDRVAHVVDRLPKLKLLIEVDDGGPPQVPGARSTKRWSREPNRCRASTASEDDIYMLYTGGTTGMPKGVMYAIGELTDARRSAGLPLIGLRPPTRGDWSRRWSPARQAGTQVVSIPCAPLMHGTGACGGVHDPTAAGGHIVTLDAAAVSTPTNSSRRSSASRATTITIVGDTLAKPIIKAIDEGKPTARRTTPRRSKLFISSGVMWTTEVKQPLVDRIEQAC